MIRRSSCGFDPNFERRRIDLHMRPLTMLADHWLKFGAELVLLPPASLFLLFVAGLVVARRRRWLGGGMQLGAVILLIALSLPIVAQNLLRSLEPEGPLDLATVARSGAGAIVVLAGDLAETPEYGGVTIGALTLERLRYAARLARQSALPVLVTGGIFDAGGRPLAALMRDALTADFGVAAPWIEERAQTTDENARFSAAILRSEGIGTVVLVTHAFHMRRAALAFAEARLTVVAAPTMFTPSGTAPETLVPSARALRLSYFALHGWLGLVWYRLGYLV